MQCRSCGTEIADKAIVCFRCGTPTLDPAAQPSRPSAGADRRALGVGWVLAALGGLLVGLAAAVFTPDGNWLHSVALAAGGASGGLLWWWLRGRGRGRRGGRLG